MERIFLTNDQKGVLKSFGENNLFDPSEMPNVSFNDCEILNQYGLIEYFRMCESFEDSLYILTPKGRAYIQQYPNLENPKTEEEKDRINRRWELKMNASNWLFSLIIAILSALFGYWLGKT